MPIYEFHCNECDLKFEELLRYPTQERVSVICPDCKGQNLTRIFSGFSISQGSISNTDKINASRCSGCHASSCNNCSI